MKRKGLREQEMDVECLNWPTAKVGHGDDDGGKEPWVDTYYCQCLFPSHRPSSNSPPPTTYSQKNHYIMRGLFNAVLTACALSIPFAQALPKISRSGKFLYDDTGKRFFIKVRLYL